MSNIEELLPCPFCGESKFKFSRMIFGSTEWEFLKCLNCKCRMQHFKKDLLIKAWNKRVRII